MAPSTNELREAMRARLTGTGFEDRTLSRWIAELPEAELTDAVELLTVALDAAPKSRFLALFVIRTELQQPDTLLPHPERLAFLRWVIRSRVTHAQIRKHVRELREAATPDLRSQLLEKLEASAGPETTTLQHAHSILVHGWRAAPADARPTGLVHRGEPTPFIGSRNTALLAVFVARRLAHLVPKSERSTFDRLLALVERASSENRDELEDAIMRAPKDGPAGLARTACMEARTAMRRPDAIGSAMRPAIPKAVTYLLDAEGKDAVRAFLQAIDDELRRLDIVHAVELKKKQPSSPIARAVHRGCASGKSGKIVLWLAELEDKRFGLLSKQGRLWAWSEGSRDDVLPLIPDKYFEGAVMAAGET